MKDIQKGLYEEGLEFYPLKWAVFENILFFLNWSIGFVLLWPLAYRGVPIVALAYLVALIAIQLLLKKHNCTACYYYGKRCHLGWGKFTALLFKQNSGNPTFGMKLAISYILQIPVIVFLAILAGLIYGFSVTSIALLIIFIGVNLLQLWLRKQGCVDCKMRYICPGSAAKQSCQNCKC